MMNISTPIGFCCPRLDVFRAHHFGGGGDIWVSSFSKLNVVVKSDRGTIRV